ncbi:MAG: hypothetical protein GY702_23445 [Desulfobulbaceae bacterium]|nr:hypothetical protein [Desulfobulbaceae bacterium]
MATQSTQKAKLTVWIPIIVSIASLVFGFFQYFDKRSQGKTLAALGKERQKLELKIQKAELREKQANISVHYVVTDFQSIQEWIDHQTTFDEALLKWLRFLEKTLPFTASLHHRENTVYKEIKSYEEDITNHYLAFLLLQNTGKSDAKSIHIGFDAIGKDDEQDQVNLLVMDHLEPGHGVMIPIEHYDIQANKHFGTWLIPANNLSYLDTYLQENKQLKVRQKDTAAAILGPTLRLEE